MEKWEIKLKLKTVRDDAFRLITNIDNFDKTIDNCLTPEEIEHACDHFDIEEGLKCISVFDIYEE